MTFGRPMTIPDEHIQLPLPRPENHGLLGHAIEESIPTEEARSVAFFNATMYAVMAPAHPNPPAKLYPENSTH